MIVDHLENLPIFLNLKRSSTVKKIFDKVAPRGITPIAEKLEELLLGYLGTLETAKARKDAGDPAAMKSIKPINFIILTDGAPSAYRLSLVNSAGADDFVADDPEDVIVTTARRLDRGNFPITQVNGNLRPHTT